MFGSDAEKRIPLTITLANGEKIRGSVAAGAGARLEFELNKEGIFLNLKDMTGQTRFVAKSNIIEIVEGNEEKIAVMPELVYGRAPHQVLRVDANASPETIRQAFTTLARIYHPDSYHADTTAPEVAAYVSAMFQQINAAYTALKAVKAEAA